MSGARAKLNSNFRASSWAEIFSSRFWNWREKSEAGCGFGDEVGSKLDEEILFAAFKTSKLISVSKLEVGFSGD